MKPVAWYEACVEDVRKARTRAATDEGRELTEEDAAVTAEALARYTERLDAWFEDTCVPAHLHVPQCPITLAWLYRYYGTTGKQHPCSKQRTIFEG